LGIQVADAGVLVLGLDKLLRNFRLIRPTLGFHVLVDEAFELEWSG
jgi:hypothetical protein